MKRLSLSTALCMSFAAAASAQLRVAPESMRFQEMDTDRNGEISREEWRGAFDRLDANRDGRLTIQEVGNSTEPVSPQQSAAYRAGYERGRSEGVQAGKEDKPRVWDLEGQRELETADAGYEARMGDRAEYQAGYRTGFRRGYREGFGPRECGVRSAECGVRSAECGVRSAECGMRSAEHRAPSTEHRAPSTEH